MTPDPESDRDAALASALRLVLVTDDRVVGQRDWVEVCRAAVDGGVSAVQVRHPRATGRELASLARTLIDTLSVPVFVNDRLDVAIAVGAAGVHLGRDDVPVALARRAAPAGLVVGASVGLDDEVEPGRLADYWGVGPVRASPSKDAGAPIGVDGFAGFRTRAAGIPCVAIGGVRPEDVGPLVRAGAAGVAVVSGILATGDVSTAARSYREALQRAERA